MTHVFVETNWVVEVCAPAFRRSQAALTLLHRAARHEITLHVPSIAFREARSVIRRKHQPKESRILQKFRRWAEAEGLLDPKIARNANDFLALFSNTVSGELDQLNQRIQEVEGAEGLDVFALSDSMLERALLLRDEVPEPELEAFDEAILAAVLVRVTGFRGGGRLIFCTMDLGLSPVDRRGNSRTHLKAAYDAVGLEVRTSFDLS